jgi:hypothetical protein
MLAKFRILVVLCFFAFPFSAHAAYAFIKVAANTANAATVSFLPTNPGDLLVVDVQTSSGGGTPTASIADDQSSSWSTAIATVNATGGFWQTRFYLVNCSGAITLLTLTFAGGTPGTTNIEVLEYSGIATVTPHIVSNTPNVQVNPGTTTDIITSGNVNVTAQPALLLGWSFDPSGNAIAVGTGFTSRASSSSVATRWEDKRVTATGNAAATFTSATHGGTDTFVTIVSAFAEPGGGGGGPSNQPLSLTGIADLFRGPAANDPRMAMDRLILPHFKKVA